MTDRHPPAYDVISVHVAISKEMTETARLYALSEMIHSSAKYPVLSLHAVLVKSSLSKIKTTKSLRKGKLPFSPLLYLRDISRMS